MQEKILEFFKLYSKLFQECNINALCNLHYIPNSFIFNKLNQQVKGFTLFNELQHYLQHDFFSQLNIEKKTQNSVEILRVHSITPTLVMVEADWTHYHEDSTTPLMKVRCLYILRLINQELKIASTTFDIQYN